MDTAAMGAMGAMGPTQSWCVLLDAWRLAAEGECVPQAAN